MPGVAIDRDDVQSQQHQNPYTSSVSESKSIVKTETSHTLRQEPSVKTTLPIMASSNTTTSASGTDSTASPVVQAPTQVMDVTNRCPEIIYILSQVKAEMYCTKCNSKSPVGRPKSQSCFLCGDDVATTQNGVTEAEIKLSGLETLVYQCKRHNEFAWQRGFSRMCVACRRPISDSFFCSFAIKCAGCSFGDSSSSARCCRIITEEDD